MFAVREYRQPYKQQVIVAQNKRRHTVRDAVGGILAVLACIGIALLAFSTAYPPYNPQHTTTVRVQQGDTVYGLAVRYDKGSNISEVESWITKHNGLKNAEIHPNQVLVVPVKNENSQG